MPKLIDDELWQRIFTLHTRSAGNANVMEYSNVRFLSLALCGEAGELANLVKKQWRDGKAKHLGQAALDEVADVVVYSLILYCALGGDPQHEDGLRANIMRKLDQFEGKLVEWEKPAA
jgi:NTP pyrophosphatase (non-canonical NTP hydrolase)